MWQTGQEYLRGEYLEPGKPSHIFQTGSLEARDYDVAHKKKRRKARNGFGYLELVLYSMRELAKLRFCDPRTCIGPI